jgi:RNA polymerase sigma-70 factor (ECF subfamily)
MTTSQTLTLTQTLTRRAHLTSLPTGPDVQPTAAEQPTVMDDAQLEALYTQYGPSLRRYLISLTFGDQHLAEDILQETLLRAWRTPALVNDRSDSARAWLTTVARNIVIDRLRRRGRRPQESGADALPQIAEPTCEIDRVLTSLTVRDALAKLTPTRRHILVEMYFNQRSLNEVSQSLGIPVGTVKSRAHYALRALRAHLDDTTPTTTLERKAA